VIKAKHKVIAGDYTRKAKIIEEQISLQQRPAKVLQQSVFAVGGTIKKPDVKKEVKEIDLPPDLVFKELASHGIKHRPSKKLNKSLLGDIHAYLERGELPLFVL